jgi:hypothetical protein
MVNAMAKQGIFFGMGIINIISVKREMYLEKECDIIKMRS